MPKKKVTTKSKQTKSPKESRGVRRRDIERKIMQNSEEQVKEAFSDESALHSDESKFESDDDENDSQPRIDEDLESPSSEEEDKKDTDEGEDESESDEDEAETKYEDSDEEIRPSSKKTRLNSGIVLKAKKFETKKSKSHKEPKWRWKKIHSYKKYVDLQQQLNRGNNINTNPEPLNTYNNKSLKDNKENPVYYLQLLLDDKFFEKVIHETNLAKKNQPAIEKE